MATSKSNKAKATASKSKSATAASKSSAAAIKASKPKKSAPPKAKRASAAGADRDLVASRAYQIWEEQGRPEGCAEEHWRQAEKEVNGG